MDPFIKLAKYGYIVRTNMDKPVGEIFDYESPEALIGIMFLAELMARFREMGIASLTMLSNSHSFITHIPSKTLVSNFLIDNKLRTVVEDGYFIMVVQYENKLSSRNYVVLKIKEDGSNIIILDIYEHLKDPTYLTEINISVVDNKIAILKTLFSIATGELAVLNNNT